MNETERERGLGVLLRRFAGSKFTASGYSHWRITFIPLTHFWLLILESTLYSFLGGENCKGLHGAVACEDCFYRFTQVSACGT